MNFTSRNHEDFIYQTYRELGNTQSVQEFTNLMYSLNKTDLILLLTLSFNRGYEIDRVN